MPNFSPPIFQAVNAAPTRVSTTSTGGQTSNGGSYGINFSPDMQFAAFFADSDNLVDGDTNHRRDVFLKNLSTGAVIRLSVTADGVQGNDDSVAPIFLPGGGKVAFLSWANNLVAGDTNSFVDIFIKDLATGVITRASTHSDGSQFAGGPGGLGSGAGVPVFNADGSKMAFVFNANDVQGIFIKDLVTGTLTLAVNNPGTVSGEPQFSPDGTKLLYKGIVEGTIHTGIYLKDLASGTVTLVSTNAAGVPADADSLNASFSPDGTRIVFASGGRNLVADTPNGNGQVFIKDLITGAVTVVSTDTAGVMHDGIRPVFSPDGTKVAFTAGDTMGPNDQNHFLDIYVKDLLTGETVLVSVDVDGTQSPSGSDNAVWSPDGLFVGFYSDNLVRPDTNGGNEVYMARLLLPAPYVEGGAPVQVVPMARALDLGSANFDLGSLTVAISGGSVAGDLLTLALSSAPGESIAISGNQVFVNGAMVGTIVSSATSLAISFNANANNPVVELLTEAVRISSTSDNPTAAVRTITFTLNDGEGTQDGVSDTTFFTRKVAFIPVGDEPGQQILGTPGADSLAGGGGNDVIDGLGGADTMAGHAGNDIYYVDSAGDRVVEASGQGRDVVYASASWELTAGSEIEVLSTISQAATEAMALVGNALGQEIYGNAGANFLQGGGGADYLFGFGGNDTYVVSGTSEHVFESAGGGRDIIYTPVDYTLEAGQEIEILSAASQAGTAPLVLVGNELGQEIYGNAGSNFLQGGGGTDYLIGLGGNDRYYVAGPGDNVVESAGGGTRDVIYTPNDYTMIGGVEVEVLSSSNQAGTGAQTLIGNEFAQEIYGNAGVNFIEGGGGADYLAGLAGNDVYVVDSADDYVAEGAGGGRDVVYAQVSYALAAGQEIEVLSASSAAGTGSINLTGNNLANELYGNAGANVLNGGAGADYLVGYGGADTFAFTTALGGGNVDQLADFFAVDDTIALDDAVFAGLTPGGLPASAFVAGSAAGDADDRIIYNSANGQILFDADGSGSGAAILFATVQPGTVLTASDFAVI